MIAAFVLAASLVADPPSTPHMHRRHRPSSAPRMATGDEIEPGYGRGWVQPLPPSQKRVKQWSRPWDPSKTKYRAHNMRAKSYFNYRLTPNEAIWFMWQHPRFYPRHQQ